MGHGYIYLGLIWRIFMVNCGKIYTIHGWYGYSIPPPIAKKNPTHKKLYRNSQDQREDRFLGPANKNHQDGNTLWHQHLNVSYRQLENHRLSKNMAYIYTVYIYIYQKNTGIQYTYSTGPKALKNTFQNHRQEKHLDRDFSALVVDLGRFPIVSNKEL